LDLGSGTGYGMTLALKKFPKAKVTGIDFSPRMINKSQKKLKAFSKRIKLVKGDFHKIGLGGKYEAIVSAVTIHNSPHKEKTKLFRKIFNSLAKGGFFVNADFIEGETAELDNCYRRIYREFLENKLSGQELKIWLKHAFEEDLPMKLSRQFKTLRSCGFSQTKLVWQFNNEAVYIAGK